MRIAGLRKAFEQFTKRLCRGAFFSCHKLVRRFTRSERQVLLIWCDVLRQQWHSQPGQADGDEKIRIRDVVLSEKAVCVQRGFIVPEARHQQSFVIPQDLLVARLVRGAQRDPLLNIAQRL